MFSDLWKIEHEHSNKNIVAKISKYLKSYLLDQEKITKDIRKYIDLNENKNITIHQNL